MTKPMQEVLGAPECMSFVFDKDGKVSSFTGGYIMDRSVPLCVTKPLRSLVTACWMPSCILAASAQDQCHRSSCVMRVRVTHSISLAHVACGSLRKIVAVRSIFCIASAVPSTSSSAQALTPLQARGQYGEAWRVVRGALCHWSPSPTARVPEIHAGTALCESQEPHLRYAIVFPHTPVHFLPLCMQPMGLLLCYARLD